MRKLALILLAALTLVSLTACVPSEQTLDRFLNELLGVEAEEGAESPSAEAPRDAGQDDGWGEGPEPIASYRVNDDLTLSPLEASDASHPDAARHQEIWDFVRSTLPNDILRSEVRRFVIFADGLDGDLAFVEPLPDAPDQWQLAVDIDDAYDLNSEEYVRTLVHEFAHLVTLRASQVPPDTTRPRDVEEGEFYEASPVEEACETFYTGEGCSNPDSYINLFFERYWDDIYYEHLDGSNAAETQEEYDDFAVEFFDRYPDRFVNDYAATNPGEDIAESFAYFVLEDEPSGRSMADQKLRFFYEYGELVEMRTHIRRQLERDRRSRSHDGTDRVAFTLWRMAQPLFSASTHQPECSFT
jgi:hypothetical protein